MLAELAVPVVNQIRAVILKQHTLIDVGDIPYNLCHPTLIRIRGDSCNVNLACAKVNKEKDIVGDQPEARPYFGSEEISSY